MLKLLGMDFIVAKCESDQVLAKLQKINNDSIIISTDSDILLHGGKLLLNNYKTSGKEYELFQLEKILEETNFSMQQFVEFCVLCGTDYNSSISNLGPQRAFKLISEYNSIHNVELQKILNDRFQFYDVDNLIRVRNYFDEKKIEFEYVKGNNTINKEQFKQIFQDKKRFTDKRSERMMKQLQLIENLQQKQKEVLKLNIN